MLFLVRDNFSDPLFFSHIEQYIAFAIILDIANELHWKYAFASNYYFTNIYILKDIINY